MIDNLPQHVAIIPDGNRRWANLHGVSAFEGHQAGARTMRTVVDHLLRRKIKYLTVWGFSTDNWGRSRNEVSDIFHLLEMWVKGDTPWANSQGIRLCHIGRFAELPQHLQAAINKATELTKANTRMTLSVAFNYAGRAEIVDAARSLIADNIPFPNINEGLFSRYLYTNGIPDVDLVIRTAGEFRISNFLLWQTAYSELYFTLVLWPDFDEEELEKALDAYRQRKRRFGGD